MILGKMPVDVKLRWQKSLAAADADRPAIEAQGRAVFAAHRAARDAVTRLRQEREWRG
ncbi:MAG: hypothetical protein WD851_07040 [Pirellulales bacterium]